QLGAAGAAINLRGGTLRYLGTSDLTLATGPTNRPLVLGIGDGAVNVETTGVTLTIPGLVSGPGSLTKLGPATLLLTNTSNSNGGGTYINEGILAVGGAGSLGAGPVTLSGGGTWKFTTAATFSNSLTLATTGGVLDTGANAVTLSGVISGTA